VLLLTAPVLADEPRGQHGNRDDDGVTVMTLNMYFGADLTPAIQATTVPQLIGAVTHIFGVVNASDIPHRVDRIAAEIAGAKPDLVGLQEVAIWRTQFPPDFRRRPTRRTSSTTSSSCCCMGSRRAASTTSSWPRT